MARLRHPRNNCKERKVALVGLAIIFGFGLVALTPLGLGLMALIWVDPVFDIFWGPLRFYLPLLEQIHPIFSWLYPLWWILLLLIACRGYRKTAVVLYAIHVTGGPLLRYLLHGDAPFYLKNLYQPMLWVLWSPFIVFTTWYFAVAFGIRWGEVAQRVRARWRARRGRTQG